MRANALLVRCPSHLDTPVDGGGSRTLGQPSTADYIREHASNKRLLCVLHRTSTYSSQQSLEVGSLLCKLVPRDLTNILTLPAQEDYFDAGFFTYCSCHCASGCANEPRSSVNVFLSLIVHEVWSLLAATQIPKDDRLIINIFIRNNSYLFGWIALAKRGQKLVLFIIAALFGSSKQLKQMLTL